MLYFNKLKTIYEHTFIKVESFYFLVRILKDIFFLHSILDLNGVINVLKFAVSATAHTNLAKKSCFMTESAVF